MRFALLSAILLDVITRKWEVLHPPRASVSSGGASFPLRRAPWSLRSLLREDEAQISSGNSGQTRGRRRQTVQGKTSIHKETAAADTTEVNISPSREENKDKLQGVEVDRSRRSSDLEDDCSALILSLLQQDCVSGFRMDFSSSNPLTEDGEWLIQAPQFHDFMTEEEADIMGVDNSDGFFGKEPSVHDSLEAST